MADYTFNGHALVSGDTMIPQLGFWTADVYAADAEASISVGDTGSLSVLGVARVGTVVNAGREAGFVRARIVGGNGKYDAEIESRSYRGYNAGAIALDCIQDAGESDSISASYFPFPPTMRARTKPASRPAFTTVPTRATPRTESEPVSPTEIDASASAA
jgi:hypothetical protein